MLEGRAAVQRVLKRMTETSRHKNETAVCPCGNKDDRTQAPLARQ